MMQVFVLKKIIAQAKYCTSKLPPQAVCVSRKPSGTIDTFNSGQSAGGARLMSIAVQPVRRMARRKALKLLVPQVARL